MSLSLATPDWMMLTRLIYQINSINNKEQLVDDFIDLIQSVVTFSAGIFNVIKRDKDDKPVNCLSFFNVPQETLSVIPEQELNNNHFIRSLCINPTSTVSRGPSIAEVENSQIAETGIFPDGVQHALTMILQHKERLLGYLIIFRQNHEQGFCLRDMCVLEELQPHISLQFFKLSPNTNNGKLESKSLEWEQLFYNSDLTQRETEVLFLFYNGLSDYDICNELFISKSTLKKHLHHIYKKIKVKNRIELLRYLEGIVESSKLR